MQKLGPMQKPKSGNGSRGEGPKGEKRRERDLAELELSTNRQKFQDLSWQLERLREDLQSIEEELTKNN